MAEPTDPRPLPGNDGSWFLELVGSKEADPHHSATLAEMASSEPEEVAETDLGPTAGAVGAVAAGNIVGAAPSTDTSATASLDTGNGETATSGLDTSAPQPEAATPEAAAPEADVLSDWEPEEVSKPLRSRRSFRWGAALAFLVLVALIVAAVVFLPRMSEQEADDLAAAYQQSLVELRNVLPNTQAALANLTDPAATPDQIAEVVPATAELSAKAHEVTTLGSAPLPDTLSLVPRAPLEELEPVRSAMVVAGAEGDLIAVRLGHGFAYRTTVPALLATPELPTEADSTTINQLSVALAESLADSSLLVSELPEDAAFADVKAQADAAVIRFAAWQSEYLEALRSGAVDTASALIVELDEIRTDLADATTQALLVIRTDLDQQIIDLAADIEATLLVIPR